ncbi:hypothetical protein [Methylocystis bryophila]|uniref:Uncharacterized protein n=1 Tax=Methylocystis bryophila TaxID=655015 RepID=A0A1W6MS57_9HYPH|nr:hypothetical protein [Methylocystis bryophila]ARN80424.1 hypothetical protein B1812_04295 [Methylocystis bryophila]
MSSANTPFQHGLRSSAYKASPTRCHRSVRTWGDTLLAGVAEAWVHRHVDRTLPLDAAGEAHACIEAPRHKGNVVRET